MTIELLFGFGLFVLSVWLIAQPILSRSDPVLRNEESSSEADSYRSLETAREELDLDYKIGKINEADYRALQESKIDNP